MEKNLIEKLSQKWADLKYAIGHSKIAKRVASLLLAGAMAVPIALSASACTLSINDDGSNTVNQNQNSQGSTNNQGNQQGSQQGTNQGNQQGNNQGNQQGPTPSGPITPQPTEPDYSMYSPLLQTVLKSDYYNDLIENISNLHYNIDGKPTFDGGINMLEAIPYRYLKNQNINIEKIQLNQTKVSTFAYTLKDNINELYLKMDITYPNNNNNYTTQYLLKYKITDQEFEDLKMLNQNKYIQTGPFIQELDNQREPEVVGEFSIYTEIYKNFLQSFNKVELLYSVFNSNKITDYIVKSITKDEEENYYYLDMILMSENSKQSLHNGQISKLNLRLNPITRVSFDNGIFNAKGFNSYWSEGPEEVQDITCFSCGSLSSSNLLLEKGL